MNSNEIFYKLRKLKIAECKLLLCGIFLLKYTIMISLQKTVFCSNGFRRMVDLK